MAQMEDHTDNPVLKALYKRINALEEKCIHLNEENEKLKWFAMNQNKQLQQQPPDVADKRERAVNQLKDIMDIRVLRNFSQLVYHVSRFIRAANRLENEAVLSWVQSTNVLRSKLLAIDTSQVDRLEKRRLEGVLAQWVKMNEGCGESIIQTLSSVQAMQVLWSTTRLSGIRVDVERTAQVLCTQKMAFDECYQLIVDIQAEVSHGSTEELNLPNLDILVAIVSQRYNGLEDVFYRVKQRKLDLVVECATVCHAPLSKDPNEPRTTTHYHDSARPLVDELRQSLILYETLESFGHVRPKPQNNQNPPSSGNQNNNQNRDYNQNHGQNSKKKRKTNDKKENDKAHETDKIRKKNGLGLSKEHHARLLAIAKSKSVCVYNITKKCNKTDCRHSHDERLCKEALELFLK